MPFGRYPPESNGIQVPAMIKPKPVKLRRKFPETWIWANVTAGYVFGNYWKIFFWLKFNLNRSDGVARYSNTIPDTITSWYVSAFAMDQTSGLGVAGDSLKVSEFRSFRNTELTIYKPFVPDHRVPALLPQAVAALLDHSRRVGGTASSGVQLPEQTDHGGGGHAQREGRVRVCLWVQPNWGRSK